MLINPFWSFKKVYPPTNLAQIAAYLRKNKINVSLLDLNYRISKTKIMNIDLIIKESIKLVEKESASVLGLICDTIHLPFCIEFIPKFKERNPNTKIILGGNHASANPKRMFELFPIDFVVIGEGELTILELLENIDDKTKHKNIQGIAYKQNEKININEKRPPINDLSELPLPAYDLIPNLKDYLKKDETEIGISASRGCPYSCSFCASNVFWGQQRFRPVKNIINEIKYLIQNYDIKKISLDDLCLTNNWIWLNELLSELTKLKLKIRGFARIDQLDKNILTRLVAAGFYRLYHGIESGSPRLRDLLKKGIKQDTINEKIIETIKLEKEIGLQPVCSFMTGIPTETETEFEQTTKLALDLKNAGAETQFWIMTPYPGINAMKEYSDKIIEIDRWEKIKQADVFEEEQRLLFKDSLLKLKSDNPDNYMFKPDIDLKKFFQLYQEAIIKLKSERKEKILLIKPPIEEVIPPLKNVESYYENPYGFFSYASQPHGLLKIASYLKSIGKEVSLINCTAEAEKNENNSVYNIKLLEYKKTGDQQKEYPLFHCGMSYDNFEKELAKETSPDEIYITTTMTYHWRPSHKIAEICKRLFPDVPITLGGIYASLCPEHAAKSKADYIYIGQFGPAANFDTDIELLEHKPDYAIIKTTRGCPNKCSYCAVHLLEGNKMSFRNYNLAYKEINDKYLNGIKKFVFWESNLLINCKNHFEKLLDLIIKNKLDVKLWAPEGLQPNLVTQELAHKMKKAGFKEIHIPLESSDKKMEERFGRASHLDDFNRSVYFFRNAGFEKGDITAFVLIGMPKQKLDSIIDSFIKAWEAGSTPKVMPFTPIPGTKEYINYIQLIGNQNYDNLHPLLWPFAGNDLSTKELEEISSFHRIPDPIKYFKNNTIDSEIDKRIVNRLKESKTIWEEYYKENLKTLMWNNIEFPDSFIVDFARNRQQNKERVLDIGCGTGKNSKFLEEQGYEVYGVDVSSTAIKNLNKEIKNKKRFIVKDILDSLIFDSKFDFLLDVGCFHMIRKKDWKRYLENVRKLIKKKGVFLLRCFSEYGYNSSRFFADEYKQGLKSPFLNFTTKKEIVKLFGTEFVIKEIKDKFWAITKEKGKTEFKPGIYEIIMEKR